MTDYILPDPVVIDIHLPTNHKTRGYTAKMMHQAYAAGVAAEREAKKLETHLTETQAKTLATANADNARELQERIESLETQLAEERERLAYVKDGWERTLDVAEALATRLRLEPSQRLKE